MPKMVKYEEMEKHDTKDDCWMAIGGKVYDVTKFLAEHPGGEEVMLEVAGQDATDAFEDIGHSTSARDMLAKYLVGDLDGAPEKKKKTVGKAAGGGDGGGMSKILIPVVVVGALAFLAQRFYA
mmetsp:Transcript_7884/g.18193  ORF Transcript_7884/g.18193 Transcript_7884/m.18193 type:complete len:123 (-) Transcript_7884:122-490(-)